ncbi:hypothetical protein J8273_2152 [Carpediemonas membranifera]|uniref:Uncharacterized protein n=1 Tax=Carpediemonas membranifera TaxID=201153 RepID=A0A8J6AWA1_9EUKA|nr:hypothetical protein J8273_2152 [Carpediemonas membranifera]|eukprot:KAG9396421.1 hypothetical protein J8273_2152 [Carpediemonas membranifera]
MESVFSSAAKEIPGSFGIATVISNRNSEDLGLKPSVAANDLLEAFTLINEFLGGKEMPFNDVICELKLSGTSLLTKKRVHQFLHFQTRPILSLHWSTAQTPPILIISAASMTQEEHEEFIRSTRSEIEAYVAANRPLDKRQLPATPIPQCPGQAPATGRDRLLASLADVRDSPFAARRPTLRELDGLARAGADPQQIRLLRRRKFTPNQGPEPFIDTADARVRVFDAMYKQTYHTNIRKLGEIAQAVAAEMGDRSMRVHVADALIRRICEVPRSPFMIEAREVITADNDVPVEEYLKFNKLAMVGVGKHGFVAAVRDSATGGPLG